MRKRRKKISRERLIRDLQDSIEIGKDKNKAIELIAKLKGYFDNTPGELDTAKPIYVVTGTRRGGH